MLSSREFQCIALQGAAANSSTDKSQSDADTSQFEDISKWIKEVIEGDGEESLAYDSKFEFEGFSSQVGWLLPPQRSRALARQDFPFA